MSTRAEVLAKVLAKHRLVGPTIWTVECACGGQEGVDYYTHIAAALDAALAAQEGEPAAKTNVSDLHFEAQRWEEATAAGLVRTGTTDDGRAIYTAQEGERGGADRDGYWMTPDQVSEAGGMAQVAFGTYQWQEAERGGVEIAAAVEAILTKSEELVPAGRSWRDVYAQIRAALADPAGALRQHDAEVLRAAADDWPGLRDAEGNVYVWLRERADRIAGDQP